MSKEKIIVTPDEEIMELIPQFLKNREKDLVLLKEHFASENMEEIASIGHKLKGNSGGYGFHDLGTLGDQLEVAAIEKNREEVENIIAKIVEYMELVEVKSE